MKRSDATVVWRTHYYQPPLSIMPENYTTKAAIASAAFVDLKAKYKYLILLQGS